MIKIIIASHVDSVLDTTRIFWREKLGATPEQARDPRPFAEVMRDASQPA